MTATLPTAAAAPVAEQKVDTTQRAYKLYINKSAGDRKLLEMHLSTNAGAATALHWIASLAGGFDAGRADELAAAVADKSFAAATGGKSDVEAAEALRTADEFIGKVRSDARIMLALSWLRVENRSGAPAAHIVAHDTLDGGAVSWRTEDVLMAILAADGVSPRERDSWLSDVRDTINAAIRPDAVWVNRRAAFNELRAKTPISQGDLDDFFFGTNLFERERYFAVDVKPEAPDCMQAVANFLSRRAGTGKGSDFNSFGSVYRAIYDALAAAPDMRTPEAIATALSGIAGGTTPATTLAAIDAVLTGPGHRSRTKVLLARALSAGEPLDDASFIKLRDGALGDAQTCENKPEKGPRAYSDAMLADIAASCGYGYAGKPARHAPYAVMLGLAARRFAGVMSFSRNAERDRGALDVDRLRAAVPADALTWCEAYSAENGAIRPRGIGRWGDVIRAWSTCTNAEERLAAVRDVQRIRGRRAEKMGNAALFAEIAVDDSAESLRESADVLTAYVDFAEAREEVARRKAPMLTHIDPWDSPCWNEFGVSRWPIQIEPTSNGARLTLGVMGPDGIMPMTFEAQSSRFARDLGNH